MRSGKLRVPSKGTGRGFVGVIAADLHFGENGSLKGKRMYLRRMRDHLTRRFGATFAEVGYQDLWQRSRVIFAMAASDLAALQQTLDAALAYLNGQDWEVLAVEEEVVEVDA